MYGTHIYVGRHFGDFGLHLRFGDPEAFQTETRMGPETRTLPMGRPWGGLPLQKLPMENLVGLGGRLPEPSIRRKSQL